jgi:hypothetical protein
LRSSRIGRRCGRASTNGGARVLVKKDRSRRVTRAARSNKDSSSRQHLSAVRLWPLAIDSCCRKLRRSVVGGLYELSISTATTNDLTPASDHRPAISRAYHGYAKDVSNSDSNRRGPHVGHPSPGSRYCPAFPKSSAVDTHRPGTESVAANVTCR